MNTVNFTDEGLQVTHPFTGDPLGRIVSRIYEGENVQNHSFVTEAGKEYNLGPTTQKFSFVDWPEVFQPLLDQGFEVKNYQERRGGLILHAVLDQPNGPVYEDPSNWDHHLWPDAEPILRPSIVVNAGIKPGMGYHFDMGLFRLVCSNGLVIRTLGLGSYHSNHGHFSPASLAEGLFGKEVLLQHDQIKGTRLGSQEALEKINERVLSRLDQPEFWTELPPFLQSTVTPLKRLNTPLITSLQEQFEAYANSGPKAVHEMDMANIVTSAVNRTESVPSRIWGYQNTLTKSLSDLAGMFSL